MVQPQSTSQEHPADVLFRAARDARVMAAEARRLRKERAARICPAGYYLVPERCAAYSKKRVGVAARGGNGGASVGGEGAVPDVTALVAVFDKKAESMRKRMEARGHQSFSDKLLATDMELLGKALELVPLAARSVAELLSRGEAGEAAVRRAVAEAAAGAGLGLFAVQPAMLAAAVKLGHAIASKTK